MEETRARRVAPQCPRCDSVNLELCSFNNYPSEPNRQPIYVYKCQCGLAFTSYDPPPLPTRRSNFLAKPALARTA